MSSIKGSRWRPRHPHRDHYWRLTGISRSGMAEAHCTLEGCGTARTFTHWQLQNGFKRNDIVCDSESERIREQVKQHYQTGTSASSKRQEW